eukprot:TRINITY_DN86365_c0_g1_i1.p1 TRINITY_DN86365_c0_g1~~TRINITY_DN86365_c0_g1_i1.p1  ORF type:complete len:208 (-),score=52.53 TRINITY_DN86365_c0_g1_i1:128-751(-)
MGNWIETVTYNWMDNCESLSSDDEPDLLYPSWGEDDEVSKKEVELKLADREKAAEHCKNIAQPIFDEMKKVAVSKREKHMNFVICDHQGHEVNCDRVPGANIFFLKTARAKVVSLRKLGSVEQLSTSLLELAKGLGGLIDGSSAEFPIKGAVFLEYDDEKTGKRQVGYVSGSGANDANTDELIVTTGLKNAGLKDLGNGRFFSDIPK